MFTKILVPLDGTAESAVALAPAMLLAHRSGGSLTLIRVVPDGADATEVSGAFEAIDAVALEAGRSGLRVQAHVARGTPGGCIADMAARKGSDLIVMATHGRSGLGRAILGSVAERVVKDSQIPVLMIRPGGEKLRGLETLLVPVDGTPGGSLALGTAVAMARTTGAKIVLLEVIVPAGAALHGYDPLLGNVPMIYVDPAWDDERVEAAAAYVNGLARRLRRNGVIAEGRTALGRIADHIRETADAIEADLIVMSTHALTGPARTLLGSVADEVVRTARRPVLLIRRRGRESGQADLLDVEVVEESYETRTATPVV